MKRVLFLRRPACLYLLEIHIFSLYELAVGPSARVMLLSPQFIKVSDKPGFLPGHVFFLVKFQVPKETNVGCVHTDTSRM